MGEKNREIVLGHRKDYEDKKIYKLEIRIVFRHLHVMKLYI